ncbi:MAG: hypothetical protein HZB38_11305 [Planctomycetes bacterium]|nr:hypothetical protein [Planctomycetota bacterium]
MNARTIQALGLAFCVGLIALASSFMPSINAGREMVNAISQVNPIESAPPEYAFAIQAFGAFRGLLTNLAFIRAEQYKQEGKYYDAMQLASWITKLQPRFVSVWEFQAWNMAWNISVTTHTPEERWNWVYNGARLLRDEGLKYNPRAVNMYRQLSWIFGNKMSESVDEYHLFYKRQWAWRMHLLLGPPPDPLGDYRPGQPFKDLSEKIGGATDKLAQAMMHEGKRRYEAKKAAELAKKGITGRVLIDLDNVIAPTTQPLDDVPRMEGYAIATRAAYDFIKSIADAPAKLEQVFAKHPETREMVAKLRSELGVVFSDDALSEDLYWGAGGQAFGFFYPYRLLTDPPSLVMQVLKGAREDDSRRTAAEAIDKILGVRAGSPAGEELVRWFQRKVLHDVYKLDAAKLAQLVALFGPMDWRGVDAHSLYWLNEGLVAGDETISKFGNDKTNTARQIFFSLRNLYYRNRITFEPYTENVNLAYINFNPDLNFIEPMHKAYLTYGAVLENDPEYMGGAGDTFRSGHMNFLSEAVRMLYFAGRENEAQYYLEYMQRTYAVRADGSKSPELLKPLEEFVNETWNESFTYNQVVAAIDLFLRRALEELANGNVSLYTTFRNQAEQLHINWHNDTAMGPDNKLRLPPVEELEHDALAELLQTPPLAPEMTLMKVSLWQYLLLPQRQSVWDEASEFLKTECERVGFDYAKAFPEPEGMDKWRSANPGRALKKKKDDAETPVQPQN